MRLSEVSKYADPSTLPRREQEQLVGRRKRARRISQAGGTLGLMALGTRAPQGVRAVTSRSKTLSSLKPVKRIVDLEPKATRGSNTLGVLSIGTGSAGSFNYAGIQRAEAKADEKRIKKGLPSRLRQIQHTAGVARTPSTRVVVTPWVTYPSSSRRRSITATEMKKIVPGKDAKSSATRDYMAARIRANSRGLDEGRKRAGVSFTNVPYNKLSYPDRELGRNSRLRSKRALDDLAAISSARHAKVGKRDDRFLREYRDRISPKAEAGYERMRTDRNRFRRNSAIAGGLAVSNALSGIHYARRRNPIMTAGSALAGTAMIAAAADQAHAARGYNRKMESNIRRRARIRAQQGFYGEGRGLQPTDPTSKTRIKKGLMSAVRAPRLAPAGKPRVPSMPKSYGVRRGGLVRLPSGRQISRRGSVPGTGAFSR